jgi:hypothetical protein
VHSRIKFGYERTEYCWRECIPDSEPRTGSAFPDKIRATKEPRIVGGNLFPIPNPEPEVHSRIKSGYERTAYCWREFIPDSEPRAGSEFPDKIRATKELNIVGGNLLPIPNREPEVYSRIKSGLRKNCILLEGIYSRFRTVSRKCIPG